MERTLETLLADLGAAEEEHRRAVASRVGYGDLSKLPLLARQVGEEIDAAARRVDGLKAQIERISR